MGLQAASQAVTVVEPGQRRLGDHLLTFTYQPILPERNCQ